MSMNVIPPASQIYIGDQNNTSYIEKEIIKDAQKIDSNGSEIFE